MGHTHYWRIRTEAKEAVEKRLGAVLEDFARLLPHLPPLAGPDSGGPGWAGTKEGSVELLPQNLPLLARMYEAWRRENEPVGEGDLEVFLALLREAEEEVA